MWPPRPALGGGGTPTPLCTKGLALPAEDMHAGLRWQGTAKMGKQAPAELAVGMYKGGLAFGRADTGKGQRFDNDMSETYFRCGTDFWGRDSPKGR